MARQGKKHQPTDEQRRQVRAMSGYGLSKDNIANIMGITRKTLDRAYWRELEEGRSQATLRVAKSLYQKASEGNLTACIFWLKTVGKWSEKVEHSNPDGDMGGADQPTEIRIVPGPEPQGGNGQGGEDQG